MCIPRGARMTAFLIALAVVIALRVVVGVFETLAALFEVD